MNLSDKFKVLYSISAKELLFETETAEELKNHIVAEKKHVDETLDNDLAVVLEHIADCRKIYSALFGKESSKKISKKKEQHPYSNKRMLTKEKVMDGIKLLVAEDHAMFTLAELCDKIQRNTGLRANVKGIKDRVGSHVQLLKRQGVVESPERGKYRMKI